MPGDIQRLTVEPLAELEQSNSLSGDLPRSLNFKFEVLPRLSEPPLLSQGRRTLERTHTTLGGHTQAKNRQLRWRVLQRTSRKPVFLSDAQPGQERKAARRPSAELRRGRHGEAAGKPSKASEPLGTGSSHQHPERQRPAGVLQQAAGDPRRRTARTGTRGSRETVSRDPSGQARGGSRGTV